MPGGPALIWPRYFCTLRGAFVIRDARDRLRFGPDFVAARRRPERLIARAMPICTAAFHVRTGGADLPSELAASRCGCATNFGVYVLPALEQFLATDRSLASCARNRRALDRVLARTTTDVAALDQLRGALDVEGARVAPRILDLNFLWMRDDDGCWAGRPAAFVRRLRRYEGIAGRLSAEMWRRVSTALRYGALSVVAWKQSNARAPQDDVTRARLEAVASRALSGATVLDALYVFLDTIGVYRRRHGASRRTPCE